MAASDPGFAPAGLSVPRLRSGSCPERAGTYRNPVLFADYSDPDAIRVGDDYWLTASSFNHAPGLPLLHSRDLVHWTLANYALPRLRPTAHFAAPRHGGGIWAPALRFHAGRYWLFYPDPDFGLSVVTAEHPAARWSDPIRVKAGRGLIDPCPFWDDDGSGYLIHGWAKSRSGIKNRLTLHRLRADHVALADAGEVVIDGDRMEGWHTIEGPKLYKRNGYYYVFAPAGGVRDGYQAVFRARSLRGPYESRIVLAQGRTAINGPHQGAWVDTPAGEHWFLHFQERPAFGRVVHLQPVVWRDDWPLIGQPGVGHVGEPVAEFRTPVSPGPAHGPAAGRSGLASAGADAPRGAAQTPGGVVVTRAAGTDGAGASCDGGPEGCALARFGVPELAWQWEANPQPGWLTPKGAAWRLACVPLPAGENLWDAGNLLLRKFAGPAFVATARLALDARHDGERAGLIIFGRDYAWLGLRREQGRVQLVFCVCTGAHQRGGERVLAAVDEIPAAVEVRVSVDGAARCQFAYRDGGGELRPIGPVFQACSGHWVGAKVGVFASGVAAETAIPPGAATITGFVTLLWAT